MISEWKDSLVDPVREELLEKGEKPDLDTIRSLFPPLTGKPAFSPEVITANIERLETTRPTATKAVQVLLDAGVLSESSGRKRDRTFIYTEYLDLLRVGTEL